MMYVTEDQVRLYVRHLLMGWSMRFATCAATFLIPRNHWRAVCAVDLQHDISAAMGLVTSDETAIMSEIDWDGAHRQTVTNLSHWTLGSPLIFARYLNELHGANAPFELSEHDLMGGAAIETATIIQNTDRVVRWLWPLHEVNNVKLALERD